jgi:hypothetical protein
MRRGSLGSNLTRYFCERGLSVNWLDQVPIGISEQGLMIAVIDPNKPPLDALKFKEMLEIANIPTTFVGRRPDTPQVSFVFFIGPNPILPR